MSAVYYEYSWHLAEHARRPPVTHYTVEPRRTSTRRTSTINWILFLVLQMFT